VSAPGNAADLTQRWERDSPSGGWAAGEGGEILGEQVNPVRKRVEATTMHDAMVAILFMVIVMFPCFLSVETPE